MHVIGYDSIYHKNYVCPLGANADNLDKRVVIRVYSAKDLAFKALQRNVKWINFGNCAIG